LTSQLKTSPTPFPPSACSRGTLGPLPAQLVCSCQKRAYQGPLPDKFRFQFSVYLPVAIFADAATELSWAWRAGDTCVHPEPVAGVRGRRRAAVLTADGDGDAPPPHVSFGPHPNTSGKKRREYYSHQHADPLHARAYVADGPGVSVEHNKQKKEGPASYTGYCNIDFLFFMSDSWIFVYPCLALAQERS